MAQLRAYNENGGEMLELVRYQKKDLPKAVGEAYEVLSSAQLLQSEKLGLLCIPKRGILNT
ncbi:hypothetical protein [Robinsoniella peoriensis]|uniref:hypothetical protein n=1 Tax=Robinsoniella peoriensis TaxID=180332 RepID=UPI001FA6FD5E|nr:hypothetical protein [Robinsoniella peoriensis]